VIGFALRVVTMVTGKCPLALAMSVHTIEDIVNSERVVNGK
jgi:hypothetical protein